jgi:hypothetical protein
MTLPNKTEHRAIVDTHRHPVGLKLRAKMAEAGLVLRKLDLKSKALLPFNPRFALGRSVLSPGQPPLATS